MRASSLLILSVIVIAGCPDKKVDTSGMVDTAKLETKKYAFEAYPSWAAAHPDKECPAKLEELAEYINKKDTKDPWGKPYKLMCGKDVPEGARYIAISSPGPDGNEGTADDIKSWE